MMEEIENGMLRPLWREIKREYNNYCSDCECGIDHGEKYFRIPWRRNYAEVLCERCTDRMTSYAKHDTKCAQCGEEIKEDDDCFVTKNAECICLSCLEEDAEADWSVC